MIIARLYSFLAGETFVRGSRDLCRRTHFYGDTHFCAAHTHTHTHVAGYISHRRSSLYVNCIRNSEYPANFLHTDHSRISAKRTSIRRSLHHKFRRTWCNAHLVEAPALHLGCAKRAPLLSTVLRLCPANSRVFRVFAGNPARAHSRRIGSLVGGARARAHRYTILNSTVIF